MSKQYFTHPGCGVRHRLRETAENCPVGRDASWLQEREARNFGHSIEDWKSRKDAVRAEKLGITEGDCEAEVAVSPADVWVLLDVRIVQYNRVLTDEYTYKSRAVYALKERITFGSIVVLPPPPWGGPRNLGVVTGFPEDYFRGESEVKSIVRAYHDVGWERFFE